MCQCILVRRGYSTTSVISGVTFCQSTRLVYFGNVYLCRRNTDLWSLTRAMSATARIPARILHGASFFHAVQDLELGKYDFLDQIERLGRQHLSGRVLFQRLDARLVREESVVQDMELVVEYAQRVTLQQKQNIRVAKTYFIKHDHIVY